MPRMSQLLRESTLARYILVGGTGFALELVVLFVATRFFGASTLIAITLSFWIGIVASFLLQKMVAFGSRGMQFSTLSFQAVMYALLVVVNYLFSLAIAELFAGVVGIYLSRAIALLITTVWNFAAYKWVIFNEKFTGTVTTRFESRLTGAAHALSNSSIALALVLAATLAAPLLFIAAMASPVADDYFYFSQIDAAGSAMAFAIEHFNTQNGRFVQALTVGVLYSAFGTHAVAIAPILLFLAIVIALAWNLRLLVPFAKQPWLSSFALAGSITAIALFMMPSMFDVFLWLTSSTVYLGSIAMVLIGSGLTITCLRRPAARVFLVPLAALVLFAGQMFSEPTSLLAIGAWGLLLVAVLVQRSWNLLWWVSILWASLIAGFLTSFFSPGTQSRRGVVGEPLHLPSAAFNALTHFRELAASISPWMLLLLLAAVALAATNIDTARFTVRTSVFAALASLVMIFASTYGVFLISEVGSTYYPLRNFALPVFGSVLFGSLFAVFAVTAVRQRFVRSSAPNLAVAGGAVLGSVLCVLVAAPSVLGFVSLQANHLGMRASMIEYRDASVAAQIELGADPVVVPAAPVLMRSEATDILNPEEAQVEWVITPYRALAGIPAAAVLEFQHTPASYCLPAATQVKPEFVCQ